MGATPAWTTLSLTMPEVDKQWLQGFADGFYSMADEYHVALVGGDTTRGPLSVTVQLIGHIEPGKALRRSAAVPGETIYVSGTLGDAACALRQLEGGEPVDSFLLERLNRPQPRVALGCLLGGVASAAIDISDGLLADLGHILDASGCGATLWPERLPASVTLRGQPPQVVEDCQFSGGDDYELCFTLDRERRDELEELLQTQALSVTEVGVVDLRRGLRCHYADGRVTTPRIRGYDHFRAGNND